MVTKKSYGKRPLWQWVAFYLLLGIIIYGIVFYFAFGNVATPHTYVSPRNLNYTK